MEEIVAVKKGCDGTGYVRSSTAIAYDSHILMLNIYCITSSLPDALS